MMLSINRMEIEETEKRLLKKMAFTDELCQIGNRAKYREDYRQVEEEESLFGLVIFDLNGLKQVNDNKGHAKGDMLIQEFAHILKESFDGIGESYRIGGDEFLVLLKDEQIKQIDSCLTKLVALEKTHGEAIGIDINSSYGYAISSEVSVRDIDKVYFLADQRMYEMKNKIHEQRKKGTVLS